MKGPIALSETMLEALGALQRYRFLTADQLARLTKLHPTYLRQQLRRFEGLRLLGSIGNVGLRGGSKAPKLYFLTRSGYDVLLDGSGLDEDAFGPFVRPHSSTQWSPVMAHRVGTVDLLVSAEVALHASMRYRLVAARHEYRRIRRGRTQRPETSDLIEDGAGERIVPDGALVIENLETGGRGLYFVECDRGTERITTEARATYSILQKFEKYERYLRGGRFAATYAPLGAFRFATVLFATTTPARIDAIRAAAAELDATLHGYFWLAPFEAAKQDFFGCGWLSRDPQNQATTRLIKGDD